MRFHRRGKVPSTQSSDPTLIPSGDPVTDARSPPVLPAPWASLSLVKTTHNVSHREWHWKHGNTERNTFFCTTNITSSHGSHHPLLPAERWVGDTPPTPGTSGTPIPAPR